MFSAKFCCFNLKHISYVGSCFFKCFNPLKCWTSTSWDRKFSFGNTESFACLDLFGRAARGAYAGIWFEQAIIVSGLGGWRFALHFYLVMFHGAFDKDHQHKVGLFVDLCQGPTFQERGFSAQPIFAIFTPQHGKRLTKIGQTKGMLILMLILPPDEKWLTLPPDEVVHPVEEGSNEAVLEVHGRYIPCREQLDDVHITNWNA